MSSEMPSHISFTGKYIEKEINGIKINLPIYVNNDIEFYLDAVSVRELEPDMDAQPRAYDQKRAEEIAGSIKAKVLMQPILVREIKGKDKKQIVEGQHRWRACKDFLSYELIPAIVYMNMDKTMAIHCGLDVNKDDMPRRLGGEALAKKSLTIIEVTRYELETKLGRPVTEKEIFAELGYYKSGRIRELLVFSRVQHIKNDPFCKISSFVSDERGSLITSTNLGNFIKHLIRTSYEEKPESLRDDELYNIKQILDFFAETIIVGKWDQNNPKSTAPEHMHARNMCRDRSLETLGVIAAQILSNCGGRSVQSGAAYAHKEKIDWVKFKNKYNDVLLCHRWDDADLLVERAVERILDKIEEVISLSI